jgi:hypothetical protein
MDGFTEMFTELFKKTFQESKYDFVCILCAAECVI